MVTRWYFRNTNASTGPTSEVSPDTDNFPSVPADKNTPKDMSFAKGSSQTSVSGVYNNGGSAKRTMYRIFVSPSLLPQTLTGGQAGYKFGVAVQESNGLMDLTPRWFAYVWRSGSGNVKTIVDPTNGHEHGTSETGCLITGITGASGDFAIQNGDRIVVEAWWDIPNTKSADYTATGYYDGTTDVTDGGATSNAAGYFECPQNLLTGASSKASGSWRFAIGYPVSLSEFKYRKSHVINYATGAGTNYQMKIVVHYGNGSDNGQDVYCGNKCRPDFGDVRFADDDGVTELDYWMEKKTDSDNAVFWVEVKDDLSSQNRTIYIYYGHSIAQTKSNGDNTFLTFRDLVEDLYAQFGALDLTTYGNGSDPGDGFTTSESTGGVFISPCLWFRSYGGKKHSRAYGDIHFEGYLASGNNGTCGFNARMRTSAAPTGWQTSNSYTANSSLNEKHIAVIDYKKSLTNSGSARFMSTWSPWDDIPTGTDVSYVDLTSTSRTIVELTATGTVAHFKTDTSTDAGTDFYALYLAEAKYVSPEPSHGSWGAAESFEKLSSSFSISAAVPASKDMSASFTIPVKAFSTLSSSIWLRIEETNLSSNFSLPLTISDLSASMTIKNKGLTQLSSSFFISGVDYRDLSGSITLPGYNWLTGWNYRKLHTINYASGAGTGYQTRIKIHYGTGSDSGVDVYCGNKCKSDFGDIRFTRADGNALEDYWMETKTDGTSAIFWIEISDDLSSVNRSIWVYYGKSDASTISSGSDTFPSLFTHFEGGSLPSGWEDWMTEYGTRTVENSMVKLLGNGGAPPEPQERSIRCTTAFSPDHCLMFKLGKIVNGGEFHYTHTGEADYPWGNGMQNGVTFQTSNVLYWGTLMTMSGGYYSWGSNDLIGTPPLWITRTSSLVKYFRNYTYSSSKSDYIPSGSLYPYFSINRSDSAGSTEELWVDWTAIRKWTDPEPGHGAWGPEQAFYQASSKNLSSKFILPYPGSANLSSSIIIQNIGSVFQRSSITVKKPGVSNLSSNFTIQKPGSTPISSSLTITSLDLSSSVTLAAETKNLSSSFTIQKSNFISLPSSVTVMFPAAANLICSLTIQKSGGQSLSSSLTLQKSNFRILSTTFGISQHANMASSFTLESWLNLSSSLTARKSDFRNLFSSFIIRKSGFQNLSSSMLVRNAGSKNGHGSFMVLKNVKKLSSSFIVAGNASFSRFSSSFLIRTQIVKNLSGSFAIFKAASAGLTANFELQFSATASLSSSVTILNYGAVNYRSNFTVRSVGAASVLLSSNFILGFTDFSAVPANVTIRLAAAENLSSWLFLTTPASQNASGSFSLQESSLTDLASNVTVKAAGFQNCRSSIILLGFGSASLLTIFGLPTVKDLSSNFSLQRSDAANLSSSMYLVMKDAADLNNTFNIRFSAYANLMCSFTAERLSAAMRSSFTVQGIGSENLSASTVIAPSIGFDLSANFLIRQTAFASMSSWLFIVISDERNLISSFSPQFSSASALASSLIPQYFGAKYCRCNFTLQWPATSSLSADFALQQSSFADLLANLILILPPDLVSNFVIQKISGENLSGNVTIRKDAVNNLASSFQVYHSSSNLSSSFGIGRYARARLSSNFIVRNWDSKDLSSSIGIHLHAYLSSNFTILSVYEFSELKATSMPKAELSTWTEDYEE